MTAAVAGLVLACGAVAAGARFDGARAYEDVRQMVSFGPRPAGSEGAAQTRRYILAQLAAAGIDAREQPFEARTPLGPIRMANVVATLPAAAPGQRVERLAFAGHYDTKLFRAFSFVGANDGGSSAALLLELGRALKARRHAVTIELIFFDGEEAMGEWVGLDHTYGSRHYVDAARKAGTLATLKALILVDMIGDRDLRILREAASTAWLTDLIWDAAKRLKKGHVFVDESTQIEDDHVPFLQAGVPAVDLIDLDYPPWHTRGDTLDKVAAGSLQIVGDVLLEALPAIESRLTAK